jgi:iron complex outermembrane receptor protein
VQNDPVQETPGYWLGNARVSYQPNDKRWQVAAFVNNWTNESEKVLSQIVTTRGVYPTGYIAPRTFGVQTTLNF